MSFADNLLTAMRKRGDPVAVGPDVGNIFFVRGMGLDHRPNGNPFNNKFNDLCGFLRVQDGDRASIVKEWPCTIDPGRQYVHDRINPAGAAAIAPGYYEAWHVGMHPMSRPNHEALVQSAGDVTVYSDDNEDGSTEGDETRSGMFGINIHGPGTGYGDRLLTDIGPVSAGCLVVPSMPMQRERMAIFKSDARYIKHKQHVFGASIFDAKEITGESPVAVTSGYRSLIGGYFATPDQASLPASIRYNNPGAVNAVAWNKELPGYAGNQNLDGTNTIAIYYTPEQGVAMWWDWMRRARAGGDTTIEDIMVRYGGSGQVAKYREYARTIAGWMGVSSDTEIDIDDDASLLPFAKALFRYEAGRSTPLSDKQILYGFAYARAGFKEPAVDEPEKPPETTSKSIDEALARIDAAVADIRRLADVATQPAPQMDWGRLLQPLLAELAPKIVPLILPYVIQMLPQLLPYILGGIFKPQQSVMSKPGVQAGAVGGLGAVLGALATHFLNK